MSGKPKSREMQKYGNLWQKVEIDSCDLWIITERAWYIAMFRHGPYVVRSNIINNKLVQCFLHRVIMGEPFNMQVDHINGNTLDNRRCNLRLCTHAENTRNAHAHGHTSKYKGVHWRKDSRKWRVQIMKNRKPIRIGHFNNEIEAAHAYDAAARQLFGEFACVNFPNPGERSACLA